MALGIDIPVTEIEEGVEKPSRTYRLDLDNKRIIGMTDGLEAVKQAVRKAIITARYEHLIYDDDYGSEVSDVIHDAGCSREFIETTLPELIRDALLQDTRILSCENFSFDFRDDSCCIDFEVQTIFGSAQINEVV